MRKELLVIKFNRENKDFDIFVHGKYICSAKNLPEAQKKAMEQAEREIKFNSLHPPLTD